MTEGLVLMVVGMATVFAFLVLLVIAMQIAATFFKKFVHLFPDEVVSESGTVSPSAAIAVALAAIRAKRG